MYIIRCYTYFEIRICFLYIYVVSLFLFYFLFYFSFFRIIFYFLYFICSCHFALSFPWVNGLPMTYSKYEASRDLINRFDKNGIGRINLIQFNMYVKRNGKVRIKRRTNNNMFITECIKVIYLWESIRTNSLQKLTILVYLLNLRSKQ